MGEVPKHFQETLKHKEAQLNTVVGQLAAARSDLDRARKAARFDLVAAEGRTKKIGILEHTVTTLRHDLRTNMERGQKIEEKMAAVERSWQNERSLRLQDLHRHDAMSSDRKHAEKQAVDMESKWFAAERRGQQLQKSMEATVRELESQRRINTAQAVEIDAQAAEVAMYRTEVFGVKRALHVKEGEISAERASTSNLRQELSRVRREFIVSTSSRTEQQSALFVNRRRTNPRQRNRCASRDSGGSPLPRGELLRALKGPRDEVSWDDVFMTRADPVGKTRNRYINNSGMSGGDSTATGDNGSGLVAQQYARHDEPPSDHPGARVKVAVGSGTRESSPSTKSLTGMSSTLHVAGSLFVGNGLGLKKNLYDVSSGGSARQYFRK